MRVAFHIEHFTLRGTEVAILKYAESLQIFQCIEVFFLTPHSALETAEKNVLSKFKNNFSFTAYHDKIEIDKIITDLGIKLFYQLNAGDDFRFLSKVVPNIIHVVFPVELQKLSNVHYIVISDWLASFVYNKNLPHINHIVESPKVSPCLRSQFGLDSKDIVFGYYGGNSSFNLEFVRNVVQRLNNKNNNLKFIFMNITRFTESPNCFFLEGSSNKEKKLSFVNTCNAMLHGRDIGETFGLSCAEFDTLTKPVFTYGLSPHRAHLSLLKKNAIRYFTAWDLEYKLIRFSQDPFINEHSEYYKSADAITTSTAMKLYFEKVIMDESQVVGNIKVSLKYKISKNVLLAFHLCSKFLNFLWSIRR